MCSALSLVTLWGGSWGTPHKQLSGNSPRAWPLRNVVYDSPILLSAGEANLKIQDMFGFQQPPAFALLSATLKILNIFGVLVFGFDIFGALGVLSHRRCFRVCLLPSVSSVCSWAYYY
jgi:hypothetical protein